MTATTASRDLLNELRQRPLLCDGAMGTELIAAGIPIGACLELCNVERRESVLEIHRRYRHAGCDMVQTNTFGGSATALARHGLSHRADELNRAGAALAREAAGDGWVLGTMGPFGDFLEPRGNMMPEKLLSIFRQQAASLVGSGADALIVETMVDPRELSIAVTAAKQTGRRVIATYAFGLGSDSFRTYVGTDVETAIGAAIDAGADVVGANCGTNLAGEDYLRLATEIVIAAGSTPTIFQPNAGQPRRVIGLDHVTYDVGPDDIAAIVPKLLEIGARIVGGCCGTSPGHIAAMAVAMRRHAT